MIDFLKNKSDLGKLMILIGFLTLVPVAVLPFYFSEAKYFWAFFAPSGVSVALGFLVCFLLRHKPAADNYFSFLKRGSLTVLFAWMYGILIGALPFLFLEGPDFLKCLFESASGWTTTGFSVMNAEELPKIFLFHRGFMQFSGGLGFILMMAMIVQSKQSMNLYNFEGHEDRLTPSVLKTARTIFFLYSAIFLVGTILYIIGGVAPFDAVVHAMSALSTGGFSSKSNNIAAYDSVYIEIVTALIMFLGMTSFAVLLLLVKRKFKQAAKVSEVRFTGVVLLLAIPLVALGLTIGLPLAFGESLRQSFFNVVSVVSTTGFSTTDYTVMPAFSLLLIIIIMLIGGAAGSTAGGLKLNRAYLLFRGAGINITKRLSAANKVDARYYFRANGKTEIDNALLRDTYAYAFMYFLVFLLTALLFTLSADATLSDALFESASLSGTVGVSVGILGPAANAGTLIIGIIGMLIARLELNIIVTGICSAFVRNR